MWYRPALSYPYSHSWPSFLFRFCLMDVLETRVLSNTKSVPYRIAVLRVNAIIYLFHNLNRWTINHSSYCTKRLKYVFLKNENLVGFKMLILLSFPLYFDRSIFKFPIVIRTNPETNGLLCLLNWKYLEPFMCSSLYLPPLWNGNCEGRI